MSSNTGTVERIKPTAEAFAEIVRGIKIERHPKRKKAIFGLEVGIPSLLTGALITGIYLGRRLRAKKS